jgi:hypothetical protein
VFVYFELDIHFAMKIDESLQAFRFLRLFPLSSQEKNMISARIYILSATYGNNSLKLDLS